MEPKSAEDEEFYDAVDDGHKIDYLRTSFGSSNSTASSGPSIPVQGGSSELENNLRLSEYAPCKGGVHPLSGLPVLHNQNKAANDGDDDSDKETENSELLSVDSKSMNSSSLALSLVLGDGTETVPVKVKVKSKKKSKLEFSNLLLTQELSFGESPTALYTAKFSLDGNYLAIGGEDGIIKVWKLLVEDTLAAASEIENYKPPKMLAIFQREPVLQFEGHTNSILEINWSRNNFLLSASMDKTVRLWHISRVDCLGIFKHPDFVTSVHFHPKDDRLFVTGSLDCRLRLWSIADKSVKAWNELPPSNYITAVSFTNSGKHVLAGTATGVCLVFEVDNFSYLTQIHVHSKRGKNRIGKKICSISPLPGSCSEDKILISSNDSRIRLYTLKDKTVISKFLSHKNDTSQIPAFFSDDGEFVISGSEDNKVFIWNVENRYRVKKLFSRTPSHHIKSVEYFSNHSKSVTCAIFSPSCVRNRLQSLGMRPVSGDPMEGLIIVAVDLNGKIKIYENNSQLESWLKFNE